MGFSEQPAFSQNQRHEQPDNSGNDKLYGNVGTRHCRQPPGSKPDSDHQQVKRSAENFDRYQNTGNRQPNHPDAHESLYPLNPFWSADYFRNIIE